MKRPFWRQFIKGLSNVWNECLVSIYVFVCCLIDWYIVIYSFVTYSRIIQSYRDVSASGRLQDLYRHLLMPTAFTIDWLNRLLAVSAIFQPFNGRIKLQPLKRPELNRSRPCHTCYDGLWLLGTCLHGLIQTQRSQYGAKEISVFIKIFKTT